MNDNHDNYSRSDSPSDSKDPSTFRFQDPSFPPLLRTPKPSFFDKNRTWLNILLFVLTVLSAFYVGLLWSLSYLYADVPDLENTLEFGPRLIFSPQVVSLTLLYVVVLLGILLAHEMGHYLTCRYYKLDATLPFFIPAPTLIGTLGAFIKIRSPITRKKHLFDVGIAGPLAGFILAVPAVIYGLSLSKPTPPLPPETSIIFGEPLLFKAIGHFFFADIPAHYDIVVHPVAFAGWVGILVTSFNLFPIGQLDGGHIVYAVFGRRARIYSRYILVIFVLMGIFFWIGWFVWALLIGFLGLRHPPLQDEHVPLSSKRKLIAVLVIVVFVLSFIPDPIQGYNLFEVIQQFSSPYTRF